MKMRKSNLIKLLSVVLLLASYTLSAEVTVLQQKVLDDYMAMKNMSPEQRKDYRTTVFSGMTPQENKAYTQAYKQVRPMLEVYLGVVNKVDPGKSDKSAQPDSSTKVVNRIAGSNITYDSGAVFGTAGMASQMLGNRFDSALNLAGTMCCFPVESSGSVTQITFNMVNTFFSSAVFSLYSNVMGTTAMRVTSMGVGVMTGLNTLPVATPTTANAYMNGAFLAGIFQFMPASTGVGVDTNSLGGQGFHAISLNDGATGANLTTVTTGGGMGLNAVFRVSGNVATPVELINFTIE